MLKKTFAAEHHLTFTKEMENYLQAILRIEKYLSLELLESYWSKKHTMFLKSLNQQPNNTSSRQYPCKHWN